MQGWQPKPIGSSIQPYGTPTHVRDLVLTLLRYQFENFPETFPYRYIPDDYENTQVTFDVSYNKDSENYGLKPLIVIERDAQQTAPIIVGDLAQHIAPVSFNRGSTLVNSVITAKVLSKIHAEVDIIGQTLFNIFLSYRVALPGVLGIHNVSSVSLSSVSRFDQDDMMFICQVDMPFSMQYRWLSERDGTLISGTTLHAKLLETTNI